MAPPQVARRWVSPPPVLPGTPYARAKSAFYLAARDIAAQAGMDLAWARLFFLYGPWEHPARIVPSAVLACLQGRPFPATSGEQVRDYLHVADAAAALWAIAASDAVGPVNVCSGEGVTLRSVLDTVEVATGGRGLIRYGEIPYGPASGCGCRGTTPSCSAPAGVRPSASRQESLTRWTGGGAELPAPCRRYDVEMTAPKFSVLLPSKDRPELLTYAIDSVLRQAFDDFEIIVSDNASSHPYADFIDSLKDPRVRRVRFEQPVPVTENWNNALSHAGGIRCDAW